MTALTWLLANITTARTDLYDDIALSMEQEVWENTEFMQ